MQAKRKQTCKQMHKQNVSKHASKTTYANTLKTTVPEINA